MQDATKLLIAIIAGVIVLLVVSFILVLSRPPQTYSTGNLPQDIAHNYLLALDREEYQRAFSYLSPSLQQPPDLETFIDDLQDTLHYQLNQDFSLVIESSEFISNDIAQVTIRRTRFDDDILFGGAADSRTFTMRLSKENDRWYLIDGGEYWSYCWDNDQQPCPTPRR